MRIDLIRHGQVPGNVEHRYVGITEEHLTVWGREQAEAAQITPADVVFVSPRLRCIETAGILYPGCLPVIIGELAECDFGAFEYKNYKELSGDPDYQAWIDSGGTIGFPGGEDMAAYRSRTLQGFRKAMEILREREEEVSSAAFVVHGGTIMAILAELADPPEDYFHWQSGNLEGYTGCFEEGKIREIQKIGTKKLKKV